ncbi:MAG: hypothetical protein WDN06_07665 [Asticcacaulis sp.]
MWRELLNKQNRAMEHKVASVTSEKAVSPAGTDGFVIARSTGAEVAAFLEDVGRAGAG